MIFIDNLIAEIVLFIKTYQHWAPVIVFTLAFGESIAILSLLMPATTILLGVGAMIGGELLPFFPIWLAATLGAIIGDFVSYWLGYHYKEKILTLPLAVKYRRFISQSEQVFYRWGILGVFIGRFFGPLRAFIPLIAGIMEMSSIKFSLANIISAPIWAFVVLAPGALGIMWLETLFN